MTKFLSAALFSCVTLLSSLPAYAQESSSMLPLLALNEEAQGVFNSLLPENPGLDSALLVLQSNRLCRGVQFKPDEIEAAVAILTGALSPSFRDNPDVSHGRMEKEQIHTLTDYDKAFDNLRRANVNCFEVELRAERIRFDLQSRGKPLAMRLARVLQQGPASSEITVQEPVVNVIVQQAPQPTILQAINKLLPWNW